VTVGILRLGCHEVVVPGRRRAAHQSGICRRLPGRQAERFGMDPAVVLRQDLGEAARPVRDSTAADLAARNRKRVTVTGKRRELDLLIASMMPARRRRC
jgi:hypothetical protein